MKDICYEVAYWNNDKLIERRIVSAANRFELKDGGTVVIPGPRHYSPIMANILDLIKDQIKSTHVYGENQGFIDQFGNYWNREESLIIATNAGQINTVREKTCPLDTLFSEDLY